MAAAMPVSVPVRATREQIEQFLTQKRIAAVGVSRNPRDFTRMLFRELRSRGYDIVPVNPSIGEIEGVSCYPEIKAIAPPVSAVLLLTLPAVTEQVVRDCLDREVTHIWMYRKSAPAMKACEEKGITVIAGECPFMFLPDASFPHRVHGFIRKIFRTYPE